MSTPSKRKGDDHERRIAAYLVENGWVHAERRKAGATLDKGDLYGILGVCIEAKNEKRIDLAGDLGRRGVYGGADLCLASSK